MFLLSFYFSSKNTTMMVRLSCFHINFWHLDWTLLAISLHIESGLEISCKRVISSATSSLFSISNNPSLAITNRSPWATSWIENSGSGLTYYHYHYRRIRLFVISRNISNVTSILYRSSK